MSPHTYTEDQQAQRTLTRPLPEGEESEQPAIGLFAELGLIKRQTAIYRKCLVYNGFVFKWKTSG